MSGGRAAGGGSRYNIAITDTEGKVRTVLARFPSVTTVIGEAEAKPALVGWAAKTGIEGVMALIDEGIDIAGASYADVRAELKKRGLTTQQISSDAATRGTAVHDYAEKLLLGLFDADSVLEEAKAKLEPEPFGYVESLVNWYKDWQADGNTMLGTEETLASLTHGFAGTADLLEQRADGRIGVSDFKTSKAIYDSHYIQGSAYALATEEMRARAGAPVQVDFISVIRFGPDGTYEVGEREPDPSVFLAMLALYEARNGLAYRSRWDRNGGK